MQAKCRPLPDEPRGYCECLTKRSKSGLKVTIKCDFNGTEDVVLTEKLYPFRNSSLVSAYVQIANATSVNVTSAFLLELLQSPSIALDVWRAKKLILQSMPEQENSQQFKDYKTFVGVGIVNCIVPEIPEKFLRDRTRGGLRINHSSVGVFRKGVFHNMKEMRYLVFENSKVDLVEGSVATEGYVTLSKISLHSWNGLLIANSTFNAIGSGAFNLTHKSDMEIANVVNSKIGFLNSSALTVKGEIGVTIRDNVFERVAKKAFLIEVTGSVVFDRNTIESWEPDALEGLICHNRTVMERNTFHVSDPTDIAMNISTTPFHTSCGNPQLFLVIRTQHPLTVVLRTMPAWGLGAALVILILSVVIGGWYAHQRQDLMMHYYRRRGRPFMDYRDRKTSQENLPNGAEIDPSATEATEEEEEGMANPIYVSVEEDVAN